MLAAVLLLAIHLRHLSDRLGMYLSAGVWFAPPILNWIRAAVWVMVVLLALMGRRISVYAAWSAALVEVAALSRPDGVSPLTALRPLILALAVAVLLSVAGSPRRGVTVLRPGRLALFSGAALLCALGPMVVWLRSTGGLSGAARGDGGFGVIAVEVRWVATVTVAAAAIAAAGLLAVVVSLDRATRRRTLVLLAPLATVLTIVQFAGERAFSIPTLDRPLLAGFWPWLLLATLPALVLVAILAWFRAPEREAGATDMCQGVRNMRIGERGRRGRRHE